MTYHVPDYFELGKEELDTIRSLLRLEYLSGDNDALHFYYKELRALRRRISNSDRQETTSGGSATARTIAMEV